MKLDVYRSCTRSEKRLVLEAFWSRESAPQPRIYEAAVQYGPFAVICLVAVALEFAVVLAISLERGWVLAWFAGFAMALTLLSTWWAVVRIRALKDSPAP